MLHCSGKNVTEKLRSRVSAMPRENRGKKCGPYTSIHGIKDVRSTEVFDLHLRALSIRFVFGYSSIHTPLEETKLKKVEEAE